MPTSAAGLAAALGSGTALGLEASDLGDGVPVAEEGGVAVVRVADEGVCPPDPELTNFMLASSCIAASSCAWRFLTTSDSCKSNHICTMAPLNNVVYIYSYRNDLVNYGRLL